MTAPTPTASSASTAPAGSWSRRTSRRVCATLGTWGRAVNTPTSWPWWPPTRRNRRSRPCSWWPWWPRCCSSPSASSSTAAACGSDAPGAGSPEGARRNQGGSSRGAPPAATPRQVCDGARTPHGSREWHSTSPLLSVYFLGCSPPFSSFSHHHRSSKAGMCSAAPAEPQGRALALCHRALPLVLGCLPWFCLLDDCF